MALQTINIGNLANDGTGDDLREAFIKVNNNFSVLNNVLDASNTEAVNIGTGEGVFAQKSDATLQFKSFHAGENITLSASGNSITITGDPAIKELYFISDNGSQVVDGGSALIRLQGGVNIQSRYTPSTQKFQFDVIGNGLVALDPSPVLSGNLQAQGRNISGAGTINANLFSGPLNGLVYGIDIRSINNNLNEFDFGGIAPIATNIIEFIVFNIDIDFGTYTPVDSPSSITVDGGAF